MTPDHDIMRGSAAWERLSNGVISGIVDQDARRMFHDIAQVLTVVVASANRLMDELEREITQLEQEDKRLHDRIDRRGEDHEALKSELLNPRNGYIPTGERKIREYVDGKFGKQLAWASGIAGAFIVSTLAYLLLGAR